MTRSSRQNSLAAGYLLVGLIAVSIGTARAEDGLAAQNLRCEYQSSPQGLDITQPRLSWVLHSRKREQEQSAYQIIVAETRESLDADVGDLWDSGKADSAQTTHVIYKGKPLRSGMQCWWKVRAWDKDGESGSWSTPAIWSMGLLEPDGWQAQWISHPADRTINETGSLPATMLRKAFQLPEAVKRATVHVTGLGLYELHINGKRVGNQVLAPEFTDYDTRIQAQTVDVTELLEEGGNALGAILADGWNGEYFFGMTLRQAQRPFAGRRGLLVQLEIEMEDGVTTRIVTDQSWRCTRGGPMRSASLYNGEVYDGRLEMPGWDKPGFDDRLWHDAVLAEHFADAKPVWQRNEAIKVVKDLQVVKVTEPKAGVFIHDMGQNMVGWCRLRVRGRAGTTVTLRHAEMLNEDGTLHTANLRAARQTDVFTKRTDKDEFYEPRFTYHGFRYVEVSGREFKPARYMPAYKPAPGDLTGRVIHSAAPEAGRFSCSSEQINGIMHMVEWTQRGNMHGIPTDCPQRDERAGWMGDIQSFAQTAIFNRDMAGFFSKWLPDVRDSQMEDGRYPNFAPMDFDRWAGGTPGWADAGTIVPWRVYQNYGDTRILKEHYESARRWVDFVHRHNPDLLWEHRLGNAFNDWLNGDTIKAEGWPKTGGAVPPRVFATAFFAQSAGIVSKMAAVLGYSDDAEKYTALAKGIRAAFNKRYVRADGRIEGDTQAGYAVALRFNLLPDDLQPMATRHMIDQFDRYGGHMSTGIQTSHRLMLELSRNGYNDEAYRLLNLRSFPSWGFMRDQGATTIWERWDGYVAGRGFQDPTMNSFNHWALGAVGEWVWRNVVGLNPDEQHPGWKHFTIAPRPGGGLTWAEGEYQSIRGAIRCAWKIADGKLQLDATVPANTTATIRVPTADPASITEGGRPVRPTSVGDDHALFDVGSGTYQFTSLHKKAQY